MTKPKVEILYDSLKTPYDSNVAMTTLNSILTSRR